MTCCGSTTCATCTTCSIGCAPTIRTYGSSRVAGAAAGATDSPNPYTRRSMPLEFRFHVAMAGAMAIGGSLIDWSQEDLARAAELVADYKRVRPLVQHG